MEQTIFLSFSEALEFLKSGEKVARSAWDDAVGETQSYVVYRKGYPHGIEANADTAKVFGIPQGWKVQINPYLQCKTADNTLENYNPSQADVLADDWYVVQEDWFSIEAEEEWYVQRELNRLKESNLLSKDMQEAHPKEKTLFVRARHWLLALLDR